MVDLDEGESRDVDLHVTPVEQHETPAAAPRDTQAGTTGAGHPTTPKAPSAGNRALVYAGLGLAAAGIAAGAVTGIIAMAKASSVNDTCRNGLSCPRSVDGDLQTGRTMGNASTIAFVAAGAGAVAGVIGLLVEPKKGTASAASAAPERWLSPWLAPGIAGLSGVARF